jgi:hypothetical protein
LHKIRALQTLEKRTAELNTLTQNIINDESRLEKGGVALPSAITSMKKGVRFDGVDTLVH